MGVFDGVGLALFIPLIKLAFGESVETGTELDRYSQFLLENFQFDLNLRNVFLLILILFSLKGIFKFIDIFSAFGLNKFLCGKSGIAVYFC